MMVRGFPPVKKRGYSSLDIASENIVSLFLIRELLGFTGITIAETGTPGKGIRFEIVVPKGRFRNKK